MKQDPIYCYTRIFTADESADDNSRTRAHLPPRSGTVPSHAPSGIQAPHHHALPNDYVINKRDVINGGADQSAIDAADKLLPVIADDSESHDHVRVVYTSQK